MDPATLKAVNRYRSMRQACVVVTELETGRDRVVGAEHAPVGALGYAIATALTTGKAVTVDIAGVAYFLNAHVPQPRIIAIGAVHITQALVGMAGAVGFDMTVVDPRTAFATPERFHGCRLVADWPQEVLTEADFDAYTALVAVTHDPKIDDWPLMSAIRANAFYVGALGSRKTHAKRVTRLKEAGLSDEAIARIQSPIGLDIGAANPPEIAVAILAEIICCLRGRKADRS